MSGLRLSDSRMEVGYKFEKSAAIHELDDLDDTRNCACRICSGESTFAA